MRILVWVVRLVVFLLLLTWAVRNVQPVTLNWLGDYVWQAPLVVMLLVSFLLGVVATLLALSAKLLRQRRELADLRQTLAQASPSAEPSAPTHPLMPPHA